MKISRRYAVAGFWATFALVVVSAVVSLAWSAALLPMMAGVIGLTVCYHTIRRHDGRQ